MSSPRQERFGRAGALVCFNHWTFMGENPTYVTWKHTFYVGLYSSFYSPISVKHGMMIETTKNQHFDTRLNDPDLHSKSQFLEKSNTSVFVVLEISQWIWIQFSMLLVCWSSYFCCLWDCLFVCTDSIQKRKFYWFEFIKYTITIILYVDTWKPIYFELGTMLDTDKLNSLILVCTVIMLQLTLLVSMQLKCSRYLIMQGRWLWRSPLPYGKNELYEHLLFWFIYRPPPPPSHPLAFFDCLKRTSRLSYRRGKSGLVMFFSVNLHLCCTLKCVLLALTVFSVANPVSVYISLCCKPWICDGGDWSCVSLHITVLQALRL